ncbi:DUF2069 domain-containing protein [Salinibius halmophilus]|uniref:DUF2069 domain-containing protein n=1 Tax=Salinibius halmophilus TaxID=1853216 RepID=UPI000E670F94|nr:DUF2069 domain-containing protein [Salinibius halmophilus]
MKQGIYHRLAAQFILLQVLIILAAVFIFSPPVQEGRVIEWILAGLFWATIFSAALLGFLPAFWQANVKAMQWFLFVAPIYFVFYVLVVTAAGPVMLAGIALSVVCLLQYAFTIAAIRAQKSNPTV